MIEDFTKVKMVEMPRNIVAGHDVLGSVREMCEGIHTGRTGTVITGTRTMDAAARDVLSYMDKIPVCARYELDGRETDDFPFVSDLARAKPVMEYLPGWKCDISKIRKFEDLPKAAQDYVLYIEKAIGCPIAYVSVGPDREALILR